MGNGASAGIAPEIGADVSASDGTKPQINTNAQAPVRESGKELMYSPKAVPSSEEVDSQAPSAFQSPQPTSKAARQTEHFEEEDGDGEDMDPVQVLFQFIPYYGRGDLANDSLVRSTLLSVPIDEIDQRDEYGNTLLLLACQYGCEDLVRIMLNKGADANSVNSAGACGLHFACYKVRQYLQHYVLLS